ncbi:MAG: GNAT family N-acetyltransferase [Hydrogenovibrio sp.]
MSSLHCVKADASHQARLKHFHKQNRLSQPLQNEAVWLAELDRRIIGVARLVPVDHLETMEFGQAWWLRGLFIHPEQRRHGYGHRLIQALQTNTGGTLYAFALPNLDAFYHRLGFQPIMAAQLPASLQTRLANYQQSKSALQAYQYRR